MQQVFRRRPRRDDFAVTRYLYETLALPAHSCAQVDAEMWQGSRFPFACKFKFLFVSHSHSVKTSLAPGRRRHQKKRGGEWKSEREKVREANRTHVLLIRGATLKCEKRRAHRRNRRSYCGPSCTALPQQHCLDSSARDGSSEINERRVNNELEVNVHWR